MPIETERKFLVQSQAWRGQDRPVRIHQAYLVNSPEAVVRVRLAGERAFLTIKGRTERASRLEFEYAIPADQAREMLDKLPFGGEVVKDRYRVDYQGFVWDVDEFFGDNAGLVLAEIELPDLGTDFPRPDWLGREVTDDPRYFNSNLGLAPYKDWKDRAGAQD